MVQKNFGEMRMMDVKKVVDYFSHNRNGKARDIGVSGSFMSSLCARGYAKIVDTEDEFVCVDGNNLYKKVEVNVYGLKITPLALAGEYNTSREKMAMVEKTKAEELIGKARNMLRDAENLLKGI
jgi:hypothetical protein